MEVQKTGYMAAMVAREQAECEKCNHRRIGEENGLSECTGPGGKREQKRECGATVWKAIQYGDDCARCGQIYMSASSIKMHEKQCWTKKVAEDIFKW